MTNIYDFHNNNNLTNKISNVEKAFFHKEILEENIEYKRIISKLENLLSKERSEKNSLQKIHEDFKIMNEQTRKEYHELEKKYLTLSIEISQLEKKHDQEILKYKNNLQKEKELYEIQIQKNFQKEIEVQRNVIFVEVENKYTEKNKTQESIIESQSNEINTLKNSNSNLQSEIDYLKNNFESEIEKMILNHKSDTRDLMFKIQVLSEKDSNEISSSYIGSLKQEVEIIKKNNHELQIEIQNNKRCLENNILEKNEIRISLLRDIDSERLKNKLLEADNDRNNHLIKNFDHEIFILKNRLQEKTEEVSVLLSDKFELSNKINEYQNQYDNFKNEIQTLRIKIEERECEFLSTLEISQQKEKNNYLNEKIEKENLISQIDFLNKELEETRLDLKNLYDKANSDIQCLKRDFYIVCEEKLMLQNKIEEVQNSYEYVVTNNEKKSFENECLEKELGNIMGKYREISIKEGENSIRIKELEDKLKIKEEELVESYKNSSNLVKLVKELGNNNNSEKYISELIKKKDYYKNKCKSTNEMLERLLNKEK